MNVVKNTDVYDDLTWSTIDEQEEQWASPQINNITFHMPSSPLVFGAQFPEQMVCNSNQESAIECQKDDAKFCKCLHTLDIGLNDVVELIIVDGGSQGENHPIHLHGHSFAVLGVEKVSYMCLWECLI